MLEFSGNHVGTEGIRAFCEGLKTNTTLQSLDLGSKDQIKEREKTEYE